MKTVAEFFAGIGLMRLVLERAVWRTVWANDIDEDKHEIYRDVVSGLIAKVEYFLPRPSWSGGWHWEP